jgi:hypothetical protein
MTKKDDATKVETAATEGARRLQLSVTRMKKLRSDAKAGGNTNSGLSVPWTQQAEKIV